MMQAAALEAVRRGARGVHVVWNGRVLEAIAVHRHGSSDYLETRHLDGSIGPTQTLEHFVALERTYESTDL